MKSLRKAIEDLVERHTSYSEYTGMISAGRPVQLLFSYTGLILTAYFSVVTALSGNYLITLFDSLAFIVLLINLIILLRNPSYSHGGTGIALVLLILCGFLYMHGGVKIHGYLWSLLLPAVNLILLGMRRGSILSFLYLLVLVITMFIPGQTPPASPYPVELETRFIIIYAGIFLVTFLYEYLNHLAMQKLGNSVRDARFAKRNRDEFISKLSHQIRTPLNNMVVLGNILSESELGEKQKELVDTLIASTNNLVDIVNNIAKVSSIEIVEPGDQESVIELRKSLENTVEFFSSRDPHRIKINIEISPEVPDRLLGNSIRLRQIILNLIENIIQGVGETELLAIIKAGIKENVHDKVFIRFDISTESNLNLSLFSIPTEKGGADAIDLGIARRLTESGGGEMNVHTGDNGSVVTFSLPFTKAAPGKTKQPGEEKVSHLYLVKRPGKTELKDANVLLVEDNLINQKIVQISLQKMVRNIDVANNGKEALDKFGTSKYDIILMDIQMPIMDGLIATQKIRELESSTKSHVPIIAITANALLGDKETCLSAGMDEYLSKPFQMEELLEKISLLLSGGSSQEVN